MECLFSPPRTQEGLKASRDLALACLHRPRFSVRAEGETGGQLTIFDRQGKTLQMLGEPDAYSRVSFSPDGLHIIAAPGSGKLSSSNSGYLIWAAARLALSDRHCRRRLLPSRSPDGSRIVIVFASYR